MYVRDDGTLVTGYTDVYDTLTVDGHLETDALEIGDYSGSSNASVLVQGTASLRSVTVGLRAPDNPPFALDKFQVGSEAAVTVTDDVRLASHADASARLEIGATGRPGGVDHFGRLDIGGDLYVGQNGEATALVGSTNDTDSTLSVDGRAYVGFNGSGHLRLEADGVAFTQGGLTVGHGSDGYGTVDITDTLLMGGAEVVVGAAGTGYVTSNLGDFYSVGQMYVGRDQGSFGDVEINGGRVITGLGGGGVDPDLEIGFEGTGVYTQSAGSTEVAEQLILGNRSTGDGTLTVSGGTVTVGDYAVIGQNGTGEATLSGSASVSVGRYLLVGDHGGSTGDLTVRGGADLSTGNGSLHIGHERSSRGDVVVSDSGSTISVGHSLYVGHKGEGHARIESGADVSVGDYAAVG
ncbi:MAG: hypothetical protein AAGG08_20575, partial [Actinomycetota bacterium]